MHAKKIKHIMGVTHLLQYVGCMKQYQTVQDNFHIQEDPDTGTVIYWTKNDIGNNGTAPYSEHLDHTQHIFDIRTFNMNIQMDELQQKVDACEYTQRNYFANMKHPTQQVTTSIFNESMSHLRATMEQKVQQTLSLFEDNLNSMIDEMIQDVYAATDDANKQMKQSLDTAQKEFEHFLSTQQKNAQNNIHQQEPSQKPPRFNVTLDPHFRKSPNPFDTTASLPNTSFRPALALSQFPPPQDQYCSAIPTTVHVEYDKLPVVNHDQAMKRAKIQFTGLGDMFVFYNQLLNGMEQFGIYLIPLQKVVYQKSLSPEKSKQYTDQFMA
jgi:hypothetical protein